MVCDLDVKIEDRITEILTIIINVISGMWTNVLSTVIHPRALVIKSNTIDNKTQEPLYTPNSNIY